MTKKKWLIFTVLFIVGYPIVSYLGGEVGRKQAADEGYLTGRYLEEKISKTCAEQPDARPEACECLAKRVVAEIPTEELNRFGEDETVNEKVASIAVDCAMETREE